MSPDELREITEDTSSQVTITLEILLQNNKLTPKEREVFHQVMLDAALLVQAKVSLLADASKAHARMQRTSSVHGSMFIDIFKEDE
jgi:hypothetical protein